MHMGNQMGFDTLDVLGFDTLDVPKKGTEPSERGGHFSEINTARSHKGEQA